jgi:hypothetical protein
MTIASTAKICGLGISTIFVMGLFVPVQPAIADLVEPIVDSVVTTPVGTYESKIVNAIGIVKGPIESCYSLVTNDYLHYELRGNYPSIVGAKVQITGLVSTDTITTCQAGQPFYVQTFRIISYPSLRDRR